MESRLNKLSASKHSAAFIERNDPFPTVCALARSVLIKEKRTDDQMLDSLAAATMGRLPTESERKLVIASVAQKHDKRAAWIDVLTTFAGTLEAKQHAAELKARSEQPEKK